MNNILEINSVVRSFTQGERQVEVLKGIDLAIAQGELVALVGQSGSGKTTLLQLLGLLDRPSSGEIRINGALVNHASDDERSTLRRKYLGFIFQFHHLLPEFSALENLMIPQMMAGVSKADASKKAHAMLVDLGLGERTHHRPAALSGGEQQRVAIGRAMVNDPALLLADEPTGNLDPETSDQVLQLFLSLARKRGMGALVVTHNPLIAQRMDRTVHMRSGKLFPS